MHIKHGKQDCVFNFTIPLSLWNDLKAYRRQHGFASAAHVIRFAIETFDFRRLLHDEEEPLRHCSIRLQYKKRNELVQQAIKSDVSIADIFRAALEALPAKPSRLLMKHAAVRNPHNKKEGQPAPATPAVPAVPMPTPAKKKQAKSERPTHALHMSQTITKKVPAAKKAPAAKKKRT